MDHDVFQSPFTWRYGSKAMRSLWSERAKRLIWRRIWLALARAQLGHGLVTAAQVDDLSAHVEQVDIPRALQIEAEIHHDLMAEIRTFAEQCPVGGGIIHLGATSTDVEDNADALRVRHACDLVLAQLADLMEALARQIDRWADTPCMAFTHLQPAEPTTIGYRLAQYGQDLLVDIQELRRVRDGIRGKGLKGAVGTSASYQELLGPANDLEDQVMRELGLDAWPVTTQTYPRKQDWLVLNALAGLAGSLHKFALDLRVLQSPTIGEWAEPFGRQQVGSSAMPFKRNPINAEKIDSLARHLVQLPRVAWDDAANSMLERTLDDSANRRVILPEAFLCADELLNTARRLVDGLQVSEPAVHRNLAAYGVFSATERLLMAAVAAGASRQEMHEVIRQHSLAAWAEVAAGRPNTLADRLAADERIGRFVPSQGIRSVHGIRELLDAGGYVGDAPERARRMAAAMRKDAG
jgi:adenylosuccinate lyase